MFTKQYLVLFYAAGEPPTLGVALCEEGGLLLRLRRNYKDSVY